MIKYCILLVIQEGEHTVLNNTVTTVNCENMQKIDKN
jgi:hypothetical protein